MSDLNDQSTRNTEAYKAVIEFNKIILTIGSTILAALISYLVFQGYPLSLRNLFSPFFFIVALLFSLFGFGHAIPAIKTNGSSKRSILYSNLSGFFMFLGIITIFFVKKKDEMKVEEILSRIEVSYNAPRKYCIELTTMNQELYLNYFLDSINIEIVYSVEKKEVILYKRIARCFNPIAMHDTIYTCPQPSKRKNRKRSCPCDTAAIVKQYKINH